ncbi:hypothetical protein EMIT0180MI3_340073 [Priestia megaterium]
MTKQFSYIPDITDFSQDPGGRKMYKKSVLYIYAAFQSKVISFTKTY